MKILLVDDNKSITETLSEFFKLKGDQYQVDTADNGALAIDKYAKFKPEVVVLDLSMPLMDGIETLTKILKIDKNANVIVASAADAQERINTCLQKGAIGYIPKPFTGEELLQTIKNALGSVNDGAIVTLFTLVRSKIEGSISKLVGKDISVVLQDVKVNTRKHVGQTFYSTKYTSEIRNIPSINEAQYTYVPEESFGATTEIAGQLDGIIVSSINKQDLHALLLGDGVVRTKVPADETFLEFFNIINTNLLSQLADSMHMTLISKQTRLYEKDTDREVEGKNLIKAWFNISWNQRNILLETHLWFNVSHLFRDSF